jgi:hypothetical protein
MRLRHILALFGAFFLFAGCPSEDDDDDAGDDDSGASDDDDNQGDDDDDDMGDDDNSDDDTYVPEETDGQISLTYTEAPSGGGGVSRSASFYAQFPTLITPASGDLVALPTSIDSCAVSVYSEADISGITPATFSYESAGTMTLSVPWGDLPNDPMVNGSELYYQLLLNADDLEFGAFYGVSTTGDAFPAFDAPYRLEMPDAVTLTWPQVGSPFHLQGPLDVQWSGGSDVPVWLFLSSVFIPTWPWEEAEYGFLACKAANDGSFSIGGADLNQLPEGAATFMLVHSSTHYKEVDGRWIAFTGTCNLSAAGEI